MRGQSGCYAAFVGALVQIIASPVGAQETESTLGNHWSVSVTSWGTASGIYVDPDGVVRTLYHPIPTQCAQLDAAELKAVVDLIVEVDLPPGVQRQDWTSPGDESVLQLTITVPKRLRTTSVSTTNYLMKLTPAGAESPTGLRAAAEKLTRKVWDLRSISTAAACKP